MVPRRWICPGARQQQIDGAVPVTGSNVAFRSVALLGAEVRSPDGVALGSVDDLVLNPETGKLGYLVIARGGFFGFDEARIPIPGMISRSRTTQVSWCWTRPKACSRPRLGSARPRSRSAQAPIARAVKWTTTGGRTCRPRRAREAPRRRAGRRRSGRPAERRLANLRRHHSPRMSPPAPTTPSYRPGRAHSRS